MRTLLYTNQFDEPIDENQLSELADYQIVYLENAQPVKIETFKKGTLSYIKHYLQENESIETALSHYLIPQYKDLRYIEVAVRESYGIYNIETLYLYSNGQLDDVCYKQLFDSFGNRICYASFDRISMDIESSSDTEKHVYDAHNNLILSFEYKGDGTINYVWGHLVDNTDQNMRGSIYLDKIPIYFPDLLSENPYYANDTFLPE